MKTKLTALAITITALSGCTHLKNLASPFRSYAGVKTSIAWDSIKVRTDAFAARYGWQKSDSTAYSVTYSNIYFYDVSLGESCQLSFYMSNDSLHSKLNPCATYDNQSRKWGSMETTYNNGLRQAFLTEAYYKVIDPSNTRADSLLKSNTFPKITTKSDIETTKTSAFGILDKYITQ
jgi:hypothetical protein